MNQELEFHEALQTFFRSLKLIPNREAASKRSIGVFHDFCFMYTYDDQHLELVAPITAWRTLCDKVAELFEGKINYKLLQLAIEDRICESIDLPFPDEVINEHCKAIYEGILPHYRLVAEALVPLANLYFHGHEELKLANAFLCPKHSNSLLMQQADKLKEYFSEPLDGCFLRIPVAGDAQNQEILAAREAENALTVLRFVTMWQTRLEGHTVVKFNPATDVTYWGEGQRRFIFYRPDQPDRVPGYSGALLEQHVMRDTDIRLAKDFYGLDHINFHYAQPSNQISSRIKRALEVYDSGVQARSNWQAIYRYVVSINVVMPTGESGEKKLKGRLQSLLQYGGNFVGTMKKDGVDDLPDNQKWAQMVRQTASHFENLYITRGQLLHGTEVQAVTDADVQAARELAHNAIRLMAFLARDFGWSSYHQAKRWFSNPCLPPSLAKTESNMSNL